MILVTGFWLLVTPGGCAKPVAPTADKPTENTQRLPGASAVQANTDAVDPEQPPEQSMEHFTMVGYASDGTKHWELEGTGASAEGIIVSVKNPDAIGYEPERTAYLTASLAQVDQTTRRVRLEHEVTIHTSDGLWLTSPTMYWLPDQDQLLTEQAVRLETDHMLVRGRGATGHTQLKTAIILRDVEVVLNPTTERPAPPPAPRDSGRAGNEGRQAGRSHPDERSHVRITCDGPLSFDYERHIATFERNVHIEDRQGDLYADKLVAYLDASSRTITYAEALGRVRMIQGAHTATSERAVYEPARGKITLLGSPSLLVLPEDGQAPAGFSTTMTASRDAVREQ